MQRQPATSASARIPRPRLSAKLGTDWLESNQPDILEGHLSPLDILDAVTERLGKPPGFFYDDYVSEAPVAADVLEAAQRMRGLGLPWQRVVHAYLVAAVRASHEGLAAASTTHAARLLIASGQARSGLKLLDVLVGMASLLPREDQDGFLTQWHSLRGWALYSRLEQALPGSLAPGAVREALQRSLQAYEAAWAVPGASPTYRAMAAYNIASIELRQERIVPAEVWLRRAQEVLEKAPAAAQEDLALAIRMSLVCVGATETPTRLPEDVARFVLNHAYRHDGSWNDSLLGAALVLLAREARDAGRFAQALAYAHRVEDPLWQRVQAGTLASAALLFLGRTDEAARRVGETLDLARCLPLTTDVSLWRSQCLVVRILCDMVQGGHVDPDSRMLRELYDSVRCWPPDDPPGTRRAPLLGFLAVARDAKRLHRIPLWLFPEWLVFSFLEIPQETYRKSRLARTIRTLRKGDIHA